ncbi:hypothetical protein SADUNF_Sadunf16G0129100 [Salix dunnii]|uniref:UDP-glucuronate decarboxylase n=1 Tax=Salix dunnii TaxID=1413687 RepID=A0A835JBE0_9ROSI|nr:hypothetical protein SADUNF_Sadunf16G0129100 [Salix dunnii]
MLATTDRARAVWQRCLASAFRTALACTIVGCTTLYGPAAVQHYIAFPAFSYVNVILIVTDAILGDALHGCWLALYATIQSVGASLPSLWLISSARFTNGTISLAVALGAFVVAFPEGTHLIAKRIALGQIVIMYVIAFINGVDTHEAIMHSLNVAASTAIGVLACVIALLLPYPRLACWELKQNCGRLAENVSERLNLFVKAFCAEDNALALTYISQAKPLTIAGAKLLSSIKRYQERVKWERLPLKLLRNSYLNLGERLQELEIPLRGMEMALSTTSSFPIRMLEAETKQGLAQQEEHVSLTLKQIKNCLPCDSSTVSESNANKIIESLQTLHATTPTNNEDLPTFFFLFCMNLFHCKSLAKPITPIQQKESSTPCKNGFFKSMWMSNMVHKRLLVAISVAAAREATFKAANVKAQGAVLGTVYGVFGCFVFERSLTLRFISLLPWLVVTSFLRHSQMYGKAGGISAVIGALLLLGRKDFGLPNEFAIARIVETFIGLSCSIMVDLILQPTRSSSLAKVQLSKCFGTLSACVGSMSLAANNKTILLEKQRRLKLDVSELGKFIREAEVVDLLLFSADAVGLLEQESQKLGASWKESVNKLNGDVELFKGMAGSLVECFEDVTLLKSLTFLEKELENKNISYDLELGKSSNLNIFKASGFKDDKIDSIINSNLQHSKEIVDKFQGADHEGERELNSPVVLCFSALVFHHCYRGAIIDRSLVGGRQRESEVRSDPMASNGNHQTTVKPPPNPSPLRNSKYAALHYIPLVDFLISNMRILVTGGAGFIGSHLVDRLMENEKNEVIVADNYFTGCKDNLRKWIGHPRFELIRHGPDAKCILNKRPGSRFLGSGLLKLSYLYTIKTNVIGTLNMLGLAKRVGARILLTSTSEVYGDPLVHPQPESYWGNVNPIGVRSCYDEGKRVAETLMFDYHRQHGIEIRIARIFNTYGPRMNIDDGRVVSNFIAQALRGEPLTVQKPGTQTRSFCYVSDMVDGLIRLMDGEHTGPINIGNPGEFTMTELAETVKELINPGVEINMVENTPDDPRQRKPDITNTKALLGWEPKVKLRDGLPLMEEDFRQRLGVTKKK